MLIKPGIETESIIFKAGIKQPTYRVSSIDLLRGIVMIIMALDHTRDYFHADSFFYDPTDLTQTNPALFFTRWITHFCAPAFMFLSGTSAFLVSQRKTKKELAIFLLTRGCWLIFLEMTIINFAWSFDPQFSTINYIVIWALGVSMIALAGLIFLPIPVIAGIGLLIVFTHNLLEPINIPGNNLKAFAWGLLHDPGEFNFLGRINFVGYPVIPWIGLMSLGYCCGTIFKKSVTPIQRKKQLIFLGLISIVLFIAIRFTNFYGDAVPWSVQNNAVFTIMSFLNLTKYPPSLLYILMTMGPLLLMLAYLEKPLNRFTKFISVFGRVPLFYYILHIYLIHLLGMLAAEFTGFDWSDMILTTWIAFDPELSGYGFNLGIVYLVWIFVVVSLYPACKWYDTYKITHKEKWWLSYL